MLPRFQHLPAVRSLALLALCFTTSACASHIDFQTHYTASQTINGQPGTGTAWTRFTLNSAGDQSLVIGSANLPTGQYVQAVNAGAAGGFRYTIGNDDLVAGGAFAFNAASSFLRFRFTVVFDGVHSSANANAVGLIRLGDTSNSTLHLELVADGRLRYSTYDSGTALIQQLFAKNAAGSTFYATPGTPYRVEGTLDYAADKLTLVIDNVPQPAFASGDGWLVGFRNPAAADNDWLVNTLNVGAAYFQTWKLDDLSLTATPHAHAVINPTGSGWIDVTQSPYNADNTGVTDATAAIQSAINDHIRIKNGMRTLYFPNGTYKITSPLQWYDGSGANAAYLTLQGQSRDGVILRVPDNHANFQSALGNGMRPAVLYVRSDNNPAWYQTQPEGEALGEGHLAFHNNILNFTLDVGAGNPAAVGIDYHASNQGVLRDVRIVAGAGSGFVGLRLDRDNVGPGLIRNVAVEGFETGVWARSQYGVTIEHLTLSGQSLTGLTNETAMLAIRGLRSTNSVPALTQTAANGQIVLLDSQLLGGAGTEHAIELNNGRLYARNVLSGGYASALTTSSGPVSGDYLYDYTSAGVGSVLTSQSRAIALPIEETPLAYDSNTANWASVADYGADPNDSVDDTSAIQAALDSGKSTVFFPAPTAVNGGSYRVSDTLVVPATVKHLDGNWADVRAVAGTNFLARGNTKPLFEVAANASAPLVLERFTLRGLGFDLVAPGILHTSTRDLAIKHSVLPSFRNGPGAGRLFLEDITNHEDGDPYHFEFPQTVWARQFNPEQYVGTKVINNGGRVWIFGYKQERASGTLRTFGGGQTELYGAILYQNHELPDDVPIFRSVDSSQTLVFATHPQPGNRLFKTLLEEKRGGTTATLLSANAASRGVIANATAYSLFSGFPSADWNPTGLPIVRVSGPATGVDEGSSGSFTFTRTGGDLTQSLAVNFTVSGTATSGSDYNALGTSVTIPANAQSVTLSVTTLNAGGDENTETVVVSLATSSNYLVGHPAAAALNIWDPVAATKSGTLPNNDRILWLRADGRHVRDAQDRVLLWRDETTHGNSAYNNEAERAAVWTASSISGKPALRFNERLMFLPKTSTLQSGGPYTERSILIAIQTSIDVSSRQSIYEEGGNGQGFGLYLKDGRLYGGAWVNGTSSWKAFASTPITPNSRHFIELYFKSTTDQLELFLNGNFVDLLGGITSIGAHNDQSALGGAFSSAFYDDLNEPRKLGGYYFKGRIHELTVHNAALNSKLRDKARKYFLPKYITGPAAQNAPQITISSPSPTPKFTSASSGLTLTLSASVTSAPGTTVTSQWVQLTGQTITFADASALNTTATFPAAGVYRFKLVADDGDLANEAVRTVVIEP